MIGNDIIDIETARVESNWQRAGYLDKIFTVAEQLLINEAENPEMMVWSLWSRKEAAYKIYNRKTQLRAFNPWQFECTAMCCLKGSHFGEVMMNGNTYFTQTIVNSAFIHSVAVSNKEDLKKVYVLESADGIEKHNGIPSVFDVQKNVFKCVSVSHHGKYKMIVSIDSTPILT